MSQCQILSVIICMGSSCFSRGNNRNIEVIQSLAENPRPGVTLETRGHLCEGLCKDGPNLLIDGQLYQQADPVTVAGALNYHVARAAARGRTDAPSAAPGGTVPGGPAQERS